MAVKFSDFTQKQDASVDVTNMVGYLVNGELNIMIPPANLDTTYVVSNLNGGASPTISIQGTKPGQAASINPSAVTLTGSGATLLNGDGIDTIDFASTKYRLNASNVGSPGTVPVILSGTEGNDAGVALSTVNLVGSGGIGLTSSGNTITITDASAGTVTSVGLTETGSALTITGSPITDSGTFNIAGAGTSSQVILGDLSLATLNAGTVTSVASGDSNTILIGGTAADPTVAAITTAGVGTGLLNLATGGQIQTAINSAIAGGVTFKGGFNANSGVIDGGSNNLTTGGARVQISVGDLYVVTTAGNFYGDATVPLAIGDQVLCKTAAAAGASLIGYWNTIESNVVPATAGVTDTSTVKGVAGFDNQMFAATANGFITSTTLNTVIITRVGAGNGLFYVDGIQQSGITLMPDVTYLIDQSDTSNDGHPLILSTTTPSQTEYSTGVIYLLDNVATAYGDYINTTNFNLATTRQVRISLNQVAPTLYYVCSIHQGMGGDISRGGDTYTLQAGAIAGSSVPIQLDAAAGADSTVSLTGGTGITLTRNSATEITIESVAGVTITKEQETGDATTTDFTLTTAAGCTVDNLAIYISGVYQNKLDASGAANFTVDAGANPTLQFVSGGTPTAPPVTAANGIEIVITR